MRPSSNLIWGIILIAAGIIFLLDNYGYVDAWNVVKTFWPLILIAIGLKILWDIKRDPEPKIIGEASRQNWQRDPSQKARYKSTVKRDILSESNIMGDVKVTVESDDFKGGSVNTVFGDTRLDLSGIVISSGEQTLRISGVFGDVRIDTPKNLPLRVSGNTLAGDISIREYEKSGIGQSLSYQSEDYDTADIKLHISISQVFGDVEIS